MVVGVFVCVLMRMQMKQDWENVDIVEGHDEYMGIHYTLLSISRCLKFSGIKSLKNG